MTSTVPDPSTLGHMKARPTVYNGVKMRSRLEAGFAQWLDELGHGWKYEPECLAQPTLGQYLPDFVITNVLDLWADKIRDVYVEVKPGVWIDNMGGATEAFDECIRMRRIVESTYPESLFMLAMDGANAYRTEFLHSFDKVDGVRSVNTARWILLSDRSPVLMPHFTDAPLPWRGEWWKGVV